MVNVIHHHHQNTTEHYFCYINHPLPEPHYRVLLADVTFGLMFCCLCSWEPMKDWQPHHALWLLLQPVQEMNSLHNEHHTDTVTCGLRTVSAIRHYCMVIKHRHKNRQMNIKWKDNMKLSYACNKDTWENGCKYPPVLNPNARWNWVVSLML